MCVEGVSSAAWIHAFPVMCVFTRLHPQGPAGLCVSGQVDLIVHLLQDLLIQLDLSVGGEVSAGQNHSLVAAGGSLRGGVDLHRQWEEDRVIWSQH